MASHQAFSSQLWHLTDQSKFDQANLLYIINGEVYKVTIGKQMSGQFSTLFISTALYGSMNSICVCIIIILLSSYSTGSASF